MSAIARAYQLARDYVRKLRARKASPPPIPNDAKRRARDAQVQHRLTELHRKFHAQSLPSRVIEADGTVRELPSDWPEDEITLTGNALALLKKRVRKS